MLKMFRDQRASSPGGGSSLPDSGEAPKAAAWGTTGKQLLRGFRWVVGGYIAIRVGRGMYEQWQRTKDYLNLPDGFYLDLDLERQVLVDRPSTNPLQLLRAGLQQLEVKQLVSILNEAKTDSRCSGLLATLGGRENFSGLAQLQEVRNALLDFKAHTQGRAATYAYTNIFGEGGTNGTAVYYLASVFDRVYMPPTGMLSLLGFETSQVFLKALLDRVHVRAQVFRREEFKGALAPLMGERFDDYQRENLNALLQDLSRQVVEGIASARKVSSHVVRAAINEAPLSAARALDLGLLDGLKYRDQVEALLEDHVKATKGQQTTTLGTADSKQQQPQPASPFSSSPTSPSSAAVAAGLAGPRVDLHRYHMAKQYEKLIAGSWWGAQPATPQGSPPFKGSRPLPFDPDNPPDSLVATAAAAARAKVPLVVVVRATGPIVQTAGPLPGGNPAQDSPQVESHKFVRALRWMRHCPEVKAVVLHVNSPGGSATASDMIARELQLVREAGKTVVAVMGDVAASGGYYIAAPATKIFAQPGTLTGSIGVIMAKINIREGLQDWGVTADSVKVGDNVDWVSPFHDLTPAQEDKVESMIESTYQDFLGVVARGRNMDVAAVRALAKGRVYTGSQAVQNGLVDEMGGLSRAVAAAKEAAGISPDPGASITMEWPSTRVPPWVNALKRFSSNPDLEGEPLSATAPSPATAAAFLATCSAAAGRGSWGDAVATWGAAAVAGALGVGSSSMWGWGAGSSGGSMWDQYGGYLQSAGCPVGSSSSSSSPLGPLQGPLTAVAATAGSPLQLQQLLLSPRVLPLLGGPTQGRLAGLMWQLQQQQQPGPHYLSMDALLVATCC